MQAADEGDFSELLQLVAQSASTTAQIYINAIREADNVGDWASALIQQLETLSNEKIRLEYSRWVSRVTELRDAFKRCITLLNKKSANLEFQIHEYDIIDSAVWKTLRSEPYPTQTWCFRVVVRGDGKKYQYVFFVGKHFRGDDDSEIDLNGSQVGILISEKEGPRESRILKENNSPVSLREILIVDNQFYRKCWEPQQGRTVWDSNVSALQIAQDFLGEVVRHRLAK